MGGTHAGTHVFMALHVSPALQSAADTHSTQLVPLHFGVPPPHATQPAPQCWSVLHVWQVMPLHHLPEPQSMSLKHCTQLEPLQIGVIAPHATQAAPQCCAVLQGAHWFDALQ